MPIEVTMPKLSPTMETGVITQWMVKVGDSVQEGDVLAEIETDKATMAMKSYDEGTIVHIDHAAGEEVALGQRVMVLAEKGEDPQQVAASMGLGGGSAKSASGPKAAQAETPGPPPKADGASTTPDRVEAAAPVAGAAAPTKPAPAADRRPDRATGNGQQSPESGNGRQAATSEEEGGQDQESGARRLKVSPLARKLAESSRIDLSRVQGSGPGGRIIRRDIEALLERQTQDRGAPATAATAVAEPVPAPAGPELSRDREAAERDLSRDREGAGRDHSLTFVALKAAERAS